MYFILILVLILILFIIYLFLEDKKYKNYIFKLRKDEKRMALLITWNAKKNNEFWEKYESELFPVLKELHHLGEIQLVLPFEHKSLTYPESIEKWTHSTIILCDGIDEITNTYKHLIAVVGDNPMLKTIDLMRLQHGIDNFYPIVEGLKRESSIEQTIEYVFSNPRNRKSYYEEQYIWSGPAMNDLHSRDKVGRFIGFELKERLYGADNFPQWDLVHVYGFTKWQLIKSIPFFFTTWNKHAKRAFGKDMTFKKKLVQWDEIRINIKTKVKQNHILTLQKK